LLWAGNHHIQKDEAGHNTVHEYPLSKQTFQNNSSSKFDISPHILMGASNSSSTGWLVNISFPFMQSQRISFSVKLTCLPGRDPLTLRSCSMILSKSGSLESVIANFVLNQLQGHSVFEQIVAVAR
jgi:hypothetical protein